MNNPLQTILGIEADKAERLRRYMIAGAVGIVSGVFFIAAVRLVTTVASKILDHVF